MQIILMQDVPHLGSLGDEVQVKNGYARNFLLPRGMAISANSKDAAQINHRRKRLEQLRGEAITVAKAEGEKVSGLELVITAKAGANGRLFGSVTNRDLQEALVKHGYEVDRRSIQIHTPIKTIGKFTATVKLHSEVKSEIEVKVVSMDLTEADLAELVAQEAEAAEAEATANADGKAAEGEVVDGKDGNGEATETGATGATASGGPAPAVVAESSEPAT